MSWNYEIFSSKSLEEAEAVLEEIEHKLESLENECPDHFKNHLCPQIDEATLISKKYFPEYLKSIRKGVNLPEGDPLKLAVEVEILFRTTKTHVILEGFDAEMEPLGAEILKVLLTKLSPAVVYAVDSWMTGAELLETIKDCKTISLDGPSSPETEKTNDSSEGAESLIEDIRTQLLNIIEKSMHSTLKRIEIERTFSKASPQIQKVLNSLLAPAPFSEKRFKAQIDLDDNQLSKILSEIQSLLRQLKQTFKN